MIEDALVTMINFKSVTLATASIAFFLPVPASAVPHVYVNAVLGVNSVEKCIENAKAKAQKHGFIDDIEVVKNHSRNSDFYATHKDTPMSIAVSCSAKLGTASIAIAGMNNDETFKMMTTYYNDF